MLATKGCPDMRPFFLVQMGTCTVWCLQVQSTCVHVVTGEGCWFISCWALNWCILYEILPCHFSVSELGPSAVTSRYHLQTTGWLHALVCSTGLCSISLGPRQSKNAAFLASDWLVDSHSTTLIGPTLMSRSTCARICAACLGLVWHPSGCCPALLIGQNAAVKVPDWLSLWLCILLSASHPGSGSADQAWERLRDI